MKRRDLLIAGAAAFAAAAPGARRAFADPGAQKKTGLVPLIHITDLYHPPQDPDDHIDLATVAALTEYDLKGVVLDATWKFMHAAPEGFDVRRDPGFIPVAQLGYLLGRSIPVASGPIRPLMHPHDTAIDRPREEQGGIRLLLDILDDARETVVVSAVGSARTLTAAFNREPALVRSKVRAVLLNAGSTAGPKREWNVGLDPEAYKGLWASGLPIHWYPCATEGGAFNPDHERGTYWKTTHAAIFHKLSPALRAWFAYAFTGNTRGDFIGALAEEVHSDVWNKILAQERNMWATISLVSGAGRVLANTPQGWRFVPSSSAAAADVWPWHLERIEASAGADAAITWKMGGGNSFIFGRKRGPGFGVAMAEALSSLLGMTDLKT